jgi:hypothetical protein
MHRRAFLRLLTTGIVGHELDLDKLLWIPGKKTFFPPIGTLTSSEIIAAEFERIIPKIQGLFERDDLFYRLINRPVEKVSSRSMRIPLEEK